MPTYTLKNKETNEEYDVVCSYSAVQEMVETNPNLERVITAPGIVSTHTSTLRKAGSEWNNLLTSIKKQSGKGNTIKT